MLGVGYFLVQTSVKCNVQTNTQRSISIYLLIPFNTRD